MDRSQVDQETISKNTAVNKAFTLLELLITLTIFSIIMGIVLSSFFQFRKQGDKADSIFKLRQELRGLENIIRRDLESVVYLNGFTEKSRYDDAKRKSGVIGRSETVDKAEHDSIYMHIYHKSSFRRTLPPSQDPNIHEVSYFLEEIEDKDTFSLKRREEFYLDLDMLDGDEDESITHTLSTKITSFDIQYFKQDKAETQKEWDSNSSDLGGKDPLPVGFEVSLILMDDQKHQLKSTFQINLHPNMGPIVNWSKRRR
jgi:prepilin-type N-terminal cleavage/methylation domain-containing protein